MELQRITEENQAARIEESREIEPLVESINTMLKRQKQSEQRREGERSAKRALNFNHKINKFSILKSSSSTSTAPKRPAPPAEPEDRPKTPRLQHFQHVRATPGSPPHMVPQRSRSGKSARDALEKFCQRWGEELPPRA
jgi:hypothetical protein